MLAGTLLLTACSSVENVNINVQIAATGTKIEAKQVVALVYGQLPDAEIDKLLYAGGDLTRVIKRLRDRYPQLKPRLDEGSIGNTASGFVALRDPAPEESLRDLLRDENRDRAFLYNQASAAVGHGGHGPLAHQAAQQGFHGAQLPLGAVLQAGGHGVGRDGRAGRPKHLHDLGLGLTDGGLHESTTDVNMQ